MPSTKTGQQTHARPTAVRASRRSELIAAGPSVRQSAKPQAALDNRSHRTPEIERHDVVLHDGGLCVLLLVAAMYGQGVYVTCP